MGNEVQQQQPTHKVDYSGIHFPGVSYDADNQESDSQSVTTTTQPNNVSSNSNQPSRFISIAGIQYTDTSTQATSGNNRKSDIINRLEASGRVVDLIQKAESKRVVKRKIITFLKKKGLSEDKILESYSEYYDQNGFHEITFNQYPLGISVAPDEDGKNAIVTKNRDYGNMLMGLSVGSMIYEMGDSNNTILFGRVDGLEYKDILRKLKRQNPPFYIVFKEVRFMFTIISSCCSNDNSSYTECRNWRTDS